jgi:hypothetical protein
MKKHEKIKRKRRQKDKEKAKREGIKRKATAFFHEKT